MRVEEINQVQKPMTMYGICEHEYYDNGRIKYMAAISVNKAENIPKDMVKRSIKSQTFFRASVPASISVPD